MSKKNSIILSSLFLIVSVVSLQAQIFGQNKVQYHPFDWHFVQSEHFDVYFYKGGFDAAVYTANMAESSYVDLQKDFKYNIAKRVKIILYNSHNDFQQTNVVDVYMSEGIGGVTELYKNRVVVPFEGSYAQLKHVLHHELVHAVMNDMLYGGSIQALVAGSVKPVPLWFSEGLAEYFSTGWDTRADMIVRDATITGYLPPIEYLNYYMAYQGGQSVFRYIAQKYGMEKIAEILHKLKGSFRFEAAIKATLGIELKDLSEDWQKGMRKEYWPDITSKKETKEIARMVTNHREEQNYLNISPAISPAGDRIVFLSDMDGKQSIYLMDILENKLVDKLIEGQNSVNFEELHWLSPGASWSPDGKKIAFAAKAGDQDALYIYDIAEGEYEQFKFGLDGVFSAAWSPEGDEIAFTGNKNSRTDLFIYNLTTKELVNISDSPFSDSDPAWSNDGKSLAFTSERGPYLRQEDIPENFKMSAHDVDNTDIYMIDRDGSNIRRVTHTSEREDNPVFSPADDKLLYVSDQSGIYNIYVHHLENDSSYAITNLLTGAFQLSLDDDGKTLAFASFFEGGWDIFTLKNPFEMEPVEVNETVYFRRLRDEQTMEIVSPDSLPAVAISDTLDEVPIKKTADYSRYVFANLPSKSEKKEQKVELEEDDYKLESGHYKVRSYRVKFSPDIINGSAQYNTLWGFQGYTQLAFSDVLGNHKIYIGTNLVFDLRNSYITAQYYYLQQRINYVLNVYHYANTYLSSRYGLTRYRNYGIAGIASWPMSKFSRFDFSVQWFNVIMEHLQANIPTETTGSIIPSVQYVHDTAEWGMTGPRDGFRGSFSVTHSPNYAKHSFEFTTLKTDLRKYFKLSDNYSFAMRFAGAVSLGADPQNFFLGGVSYWFYPKYSNGSGGSGGLRLNTLKDVYFSEFVLPLRGAYYYERIGNTYGLVNLEFRFPLISYLALGFPPITLGNIQGVVFSDIGTAWDHQQSAALRLVEDGKLKNLVSGIGVGTRIYFFGLLMKYDVAWRYDLSTTSKPIHYVSMGIDF